MTVLLQMLMRLSFGSCLKHSGLGWFFFPSSPVFSYVIYYCMELFYVNSAYLLVTSHSFSRLDANAKDRSLEKEQVCYWKMGPYQKIQSEMQMVVSAS